VTERGGAPGWDSLMFSLELAWVKGQYLFIFP